MLTARLSPTVKPLIPLHQHQQGRLLGGRNGNTRSQSRSRMSNKMSKGLKVIKSSSSSSIGDRGVTTKTTDDIVVVKKGLQQQKVRAVVSIKKKIKERLVDKIEDQWFDFITSIGQAISLPLVSDHIHHGNN